MNPSFHIAPSSGVPIYRQLMDQIRLLAASGGLHPGDPLPSVRRLATELEVNPMTISKAYSLLEAEGLLARQRGIGMIVAEGRNGKMSMQERLRLLRPALRNAVAKSKQLELDKKQTLDYFSRVWEEGE